MVVGRRRRAAAATTYKVCSLLLTYPDEELLAARGRLRDSVSELPRSGATEALERFLDWWDRSEPLTVAQHYVETIDLDKRSGLYLTFYGEGDKRERGSALLRLK